jgi:hypothetical protein
MEAHAWPVAIGALTFSSRLPEMHSFNQSITSAPCTRKLPTLADQEDTQIISQPKQIGEKGLLERNCTFIVVARLTTTSFVLKYNLSVIKPL